MASPLAVLSEAAHVYEQMEQLKMAEQLKLASNPVFTQSTEPTNHMPWVLVVPHPMAAHHAAHAQALALQAMQTNAYLAAMQQQLKQAPPEPPRNLVLQPAGSLSSGNRSLDSNESEGYPPWHVASANQSEAAAASQGAPIKTSTIVRNPAHQPKMKQKVVLRSKKSGRQTVDSHFRRSLGFETQIQPIMKKRPSSMIEHSEVDDHFIRVFGADEWKKLQAKRKKLNRHSII